MRSIVSVRRWALGAALAAIVALVGAASASAASGPPVWGPAAPYTSVPSSVPESVFTSVSCASPGNCVAVGFTLSSSSTEQTLVAAESAGTWGPSTTLTASTFPSNADPTRNSLLTSVSCASAGSCEAVGGYTDTSGAAQALAVPITVSGQSATAGQAVEVTLPAGAATGSAQRAILNGVSCDASGCVAVGRYNAGTTPTHQGMAAISTSGGGWAATELTQLPSNVDTTDPQATLNSISCPSGGACEAVGTYVDNTAAPGHQQPLAVTVTNGAPGQGVEVGLPADYTPTAPTTNSLIVVLGTTLASVSCPSTGTCIAAGSYSSTVGTTQSLAAVAVPITGGNPGTAVALQLPTNGPGSTPGGVPEGGVTSISCADAGNCSVLGYNGGAATPVTVQGAEVAGTWSALAALPFSASSGLGSNPSVGIGISCTTAQRCEGVGLVQTGTAPTLTAVPFTATSAPQLSTATSSLPAAQVNKPYSATLQASGGTGSGAWSIGPGSLPAGLSLNASTGVISGTPTVAGQSGFVATDTEAGPPAQNASAGLSIMVGAAYPVASVRVLYLRTAGKRATVVMSCSGAPCKGKLTITGVERRKGKKVTAVVASKSTKHRITLAGGRYSIAAGRGKTTVLTLTGKASRLLARLHKIAGYLNVTPTGATHPAVVKKVTFTSPAKKHKHHSKKHKHHKKK